MMNVLVCAYRAWALNVVPMIIGDHKFDVVTNQDDLLKTTKDKKYDLIVLLGWSWKIPRDITNNNFIVGMHPSDLPMYAGGSPIQNQILDGITSSIATMFVVTEKLDDGDILYKEPYSLEGHITDIFDELTRVSVKLLQSTLDNHPNHTRTIQASIAGGGLRKRIKPEASKLEIGLGDHTVKQLWNEIRCREDPYPNAFIQDKTGTLYFKHVEFIPND